MAYLDRDSESSVAYLDRDSDGSMELVQTMPTVNQSANRPVTRGWRQKVINSEVKT